MAAVRPGSVIVGRRKPAIVHRRLRPATGCCGRITGHTEAISAIGSGVRLDLKSAKKEIVILDRFSWWSGGGSIEPCYWSPRGTWPRISPPGNFVACMFAYGLIASLVLEPLPRGELTRRAEEIASRHY